MHAVRFPIQQVLRDALHHCGVRDEIRRSSWQRELHPLMQHLQTWRESALTVAKTPLHETLVYHACAVFGFVVHFELYSCQTLFLLCNILQTLDHFMLVGAFGTLTSLYAAALVTRALAMVNKQYDVALHVLKQLKDQRDTTQFAALFAHVGIDPQWWQPTTLKDSCQTKLLPVVHYTCEHWIRLGMFRRWEMVEAVLLRMQMQVALPRGVEIHVDLSSPDCNKVTLPPNHSIWTKEIHPKILEAVSRQTHRRHFHAHVSHELLMHAAKYDQRSQARLQAVWQEKQDAIIHQRQKDYFLSTVRPKLLCAVGLYQAREITRANEPRRQERKTRRKASRLQRAQQRDAQKQQEAERAQRQKTFVYRMKWLFVIRRFTFRKRVDLRKAILHKVNRLRQPAKEAYVQTKEGHEAVLLARMYHLMCNQFSLALLPCFQHFLHINSSGKQLLTDIAINLQCIADPTWLDATVTPIISMFAKSCLELTNVAHLHQVYQWVRSDPLLYPFRGIWTLLKQVPNIMLKFHALLIQLPDTSMLSVLKNEMEEVPAGLLAKFVRLTRELCFFWQLEDCDIDVVRNAWIKEGGKHYDYFNLLTMLGQMRVQVPNMKGKATVAFRNIKRMPD